MGPRAEKPIAIVGMACRLPGADNLDEFWRMLEEGRTGLGELPDDRINRDLQYDPQPGIRGKSYTSLGGIVPERPFDRDLCPLPESLIEVSHKAHLTLCEVAAHAFQQGGIDPFALQGRTTGTFLGHTPPPGNVAPVMFARLIEQTAQYLREVDGFDALVGEDREQVLREIIDRPRRPFAQDDPRLRVRANAYHGAALIAKAFNFDGPAMSFDAACASGFRAFGHAVRALQSGRLDVALAGSASYCQADTLVLFSAAQSVSPTGSRPFDNDADGLVAGEGYVVFVLKTLEQALADGDRIQAVIRSVGVSSDGKGKSLWAPRKEGQIEAIRRANAGFEDPYNQLQFIEMHATSTQVGDATELGALAEVFGPKLTDGRKIPIGSVKSNVGHTLETAGMASLLKTILAIQHQAIPPQANVSTLNTNIDWASAPFEVPLERREWPAPGEGLPRKAAVNAFGIGGLNVHVTVDEHVPDASQHLVSSASTSESGSEEPRDQSIAIIGMGSILPGALTLDALWETLCSGVAQTSDVPPERWNADLGYEADSTRPWSVPVREGGFIHGYEYDWKKHRVPPKQIQNADPLQFMLLDAADEALWDAGYRDREFDHLRTGVVVGTVFGGEFADQLQMGLRLPDFRVLLSDVLRERGVPDEDIERVADEYEEVLLKHMPALIDETGSFTASSLASQITKAFDLMGGAVAVDSGDTSAFAALESCVDVLLAGDCDMMICAAGHRAMGFGGFETMARSGMLAKSHPNGPFDAQTDGALPGEGVGVLILKRLADAQRDGDRIHAVVRGIGVARNECLEEGVETAISRAMENAGVSPEQVSVVEAGSYGRPQADRAELAAIAKSYGTPNRRGPVLLGAASSQFGLTGGASGVVSMAKAIGELNQAQMPQNVGFTDSMPLLSPHRAALVPAARTAAIPGINADGRLFAGVSSYGVHDVAYHAIVEGMRKVPCDQPATTPKPADASQTTTLASDIPDWRIARMSAASFEELLEQAAAVAASADESFAKASRDFSHNGFGTDAKFRLAVVAQDSRQLATSCKLAAKQLVKPAARTLLADKGVFYGEVGQTLPQIALMFPGQGSQYTGMLKGLIEQFPPAAEAMHRADEVLERLGLPRFAELAWAESNDLGRDVWLTQLSLMVADTIMFASLNALDLPVSRVSGHSFGELAAHVAAGTWTFEEAIRATKGRCAAMDACSESTGAMLSTSVPSDELRGLCEKIDGRLSVSHCNSPEQTVAGGDEDAISRLAEAVEAAGYRAKVLNVPAAFHTPLLEEVKSPFRESLLQLRMSPPRIPVLSSVTNRYVSDPEDVLENLVVQMTRPIDYVELVERLIDEGANVLVEVGPRSVLTGLHRQIVGDRGVFCVATDHPKREGLQQLLFARACVEVSGALDADCMRTPVWTENDDHFVAMEHDASAHDSAEESDESVDDVEGLTVVRLSGTACEMGRRHGKALREQIRTVLRRYADLAGTRWDRLHSLETLVPRAEEFFGSEGLEELRGMAEGAGVNVASLIAHNLRLYLDAGKGGVYFAINAQTNSRDGLVHAANEELQFSLGVRDCLDRIVFACHPRNKKSYLTFGVAGQVGGLNGINADGVAISTSVLLDVPGLDAVREGKLHTVLVREVLEQASDAGQAIEMISATPSTGTWSVCVSHHPSDSLCYLEYDGKNLQILPSVPSVLATNHRQMAGGEDGPAYSQRRLERLKSLLGGERPTDVRVSAAKNILRDRFDPKRGEATEQATVNTLKRVDNQISIVMQPGRGNLWVTSGPLSNGHSNEFHRLPLDRLLRRKHTASDPEAMVVSETSSRLVTTDDALVRAFDATSSRSAEQVCSRLVMRLVERPLHGTDEVAPQLHGPAIVVGSNPAADELCTQLRAAGATVEQLPVTADVDGVVAHFDQLWATCSARHLFVMTAHDEDAVTSLQADAWQDRRTRGLLIPYLVCQRWFQQMAQAKCFAESSIMAATSLGGDFGFSGKIKGVEGGGLAGLIKGVKLELEMTGGQFAYRGRVIDTDPAMTPRAVASAVVAEFAVPGDEVEVAYKNGKRYVPRPMAVSASESAGNELPRQGAFVVTGGARGVTAVVARELGRRFGVKLHLIGSSPLPEIPESYRTFSEEDLKDVKASVMKEALADGQRPMDAWGRFEKALEIDRTLHSFSTEGISATYHSCDVSNRAALGALLDEIRGADGPIRGVVHGAGFERACRFDKKQRELVERTIAAKVDGAAALMDLTRDDPLRYFAAFGSVSGRFGGVGQTDYCVSNDMLAKLVDWYRNERPDCHAALFHWHAWDDVGMAVRPESQHIRKLHNIQFMPSIEGANHLIDELCAGLPEGEVVITETGYYEEKYITPVREAASSTAGRGIDDLPLLDDIAESQPGQSVTSTLDLDPTQDVFLVQHRFKDRPMLPVVVGSESLLQTATLLLDEGEQIVRLRNIEIVNGMRFLTDDPQQMQVKAMRTATGINTELVADFHNSKGKLLQKDRPYLRGVVETASSPLVFEAAKPVVQSGDELEWTDVWYEDEIVIYHGPAFRYVRQMAADEEMGYARIQVPDFGEIAGRRTGTNWVISPALVDACLYAASTYMWYVMKGVVAIPHGIHAIHLGREPHIGEMCYAEIRFRKADEKRGLFDITLFGDDDQVVLQVEGYENVIVGEVSMESLG